VRNFIWGLPTLLTNGHVAGLFCPLTFLQIGLDHRTPMQGEAMKQSHSRSAKPWLWGIRSVRCALRPVSLTVLGMEPTDSAPLRFGLLSSISKRRRAGRRGDRLCDPGKIEFRSALAYLRAALETEATTKKRIN
jgi:hypothetical protein